MGPVVSAQSSSNTFINDTEDKNVIAMQRIKVSLRAKRGSLRKRNAFFPARLPHFIRNDI